jgi:2-C-methyl-D-erythritol 4-phosphate cytidylyltransferase
MKPKRFALIAAGGSGIRMESEVPKQFLLLQGIPILMHTINLFQSLKTISSILLVLPSHEIPRWDLLCKEYNFTIPHTVIAGGDTRFDSVKKGINAFGNEAGLIAIHDGVRPLIQPELIEKCYSFAYEFGNAIPAVRATESIRLGTHADNTKVDRNSVWQIQTPQVFFLERIRDHYKAQWQEDYTDDASVAEACGERINLIEGDIENIKITTPLDLFLANCILKGRNECSNK